MIWRIEGRGAGDSAAGGAGFTLLELLVVLAIVTLVLVLAPRLSAGSGVRVRAAARDLAADLRALRGQAIRQHAVADLVLEEGGYRLGSGTALHSFPPDTRVDFQPASVPLVGTPLRHVAFYPDGSSSGGLLTLTNDGMHLAIRIGWLDGKVSADD